MALFWSAALVLGVCGTDREIVSGAYGEAPPGSDRLVLGHEFYGEVIAAPPGGRFAVGRPHRRHRAAARPGALPGLRRRRMGHVPQRRLHRARHQGPERLRRRAVSHRTELRRQGRSGAGRTRRVAGAVERRRQGVGSHRARRPALPFLGAAATVGNRRGPSRVARGDDGHAARTTRCTCSTAPRTDRSRNWSATSARFISTARSTTSSSLPPTSSSNAPARRRSSPVSLAGRHRAASSACSASAVRVSSRSTSDKSTRRWCSTTTWCSVRSTPTADTTSWRRRRSTAPTRRGSAG